MSVTQMEKEAVTAASVLAHQFKVNESPLKKLSARLQKNPAIFAMTIARGSSDHAATFAKYLLETRSHLVTASAAPSVCTLYEAKLKLKNALVIAISQSGQSPDLAEMLTVARESGAITVAFLNKTDSPIASAAEYIIPLHAGEEVAVAATKTYLATLGALIQFTALLTQDQVLQNQLSQLPERLQQAAQLDWSEAIEIYKAQQNTFVVARGYGFPIAQEAALKFKETANIHAEAFSGAELLHGPFALVKRDFPLFLFGQQDATLKGILEVGARVKKIGGKVLLALPDGKVSGKDKENASNLVLPLPESLHPICDPLLVIQAFYVMMARLSVARGFNPDEPNHITKVTQTW
jgi:glutamine---fructose-6-phosphate transaminase (isomerizing)